MLIWRHEVVLDRTSTRLSQYFISSWRPYFSAFLWLCRRLLPSPGVFQRPIPKQIVVAKPFGSPVSYVQLSRGNGHTGSAFFSCKQQCDFCPFFSLYYILPSSYALPQALSRMSSPHPVAAALWMWACSLVSFPAQLILRVKKVPESRMGTGDGPCTSSCLLAKGFCSNRAFTYFIMPDSVTSIDAALEVLCVVLVEGFSWAQTWGKKGMRCWVLLRIVLQERTEQGQLSWGSSQKMLCAGDLCHAPSRLPAFQLLLRLSAMRAPSTDEMQLGSQALVFAQSLLQDALMLSSPPGHAARARGVSKEKGTGRKCLL